MFWLQGVVGHPTLDEGARVDSEAKVAAAFAPGDPPSHGEPALLKEEALDVLIRARVGDEKKETPVPVLRDLLSAMSRSDRENLLEEAEQASNEARVYWRPTTREDRIRSLENYDVGQQDIGGLPHMIDGQTKIQRFRNTLGWVRRLFCREMFDFL